MLPGQPACTCGVRARGAQRTTAVDCLHGPPIASTDRRLPRQTADSLYGPLMASTGKRSPLRTVDGLDGQAMASTDRRWPRQAGGSLYHR
eukprot:1196129-Prorocentrum_minimum.AAC.9